MVANNSVRPFSEVRQAERSELNCFVFFTVNSTLETANKSQQIYRLPHVAAAVSLNL